MNLNSVSRALLVFGLVLLVFSTPGNAATRTYDRIVVFGDSLSDPGNAFAVLRKVSVRPFDLIPDAPYAVGGLHFSNGETWVEQLAGILRLRRSAGPALWARGHFSNYAVGTARARAEGSYHLNEQVGLFLEDFPGGAPSHALYVVSIGANDVRDALEALAEDATGSTSTAILGGAVLAIQQSLVSLAEAGAGTFLVGNAPDISLVPAVRLQGGHVAGAAMWLAQGFNSGLESVLEGLGSAYPGIRIVRLDQFGFLGELVGNPSAFGLTEVEQPCITPGTLVKPFCSKPDDHLFWDGIHPTREGHALLAKRANAVLFQEP
jgi:phospholipase/lecithinase/hemolysin